MSSTNGSATRRTLLADSIEALLCSIEGVRAARILAGPSGAIREIQIVADPALAPQQAARNVQSALVAHFGILIDHRTVAVRTALEDADIGHHDRPVASGVEHEKHAAKDSPGPWTGSSSGRRGLKGNAPIATSSPPRVTAQITCIELERLHPHRVRCRLALDVDGAEYSGEAERLEREDARLQAAAHAAVAAVAEYERAQTADHAGRLLLGLDGITRVSLAGTDYALVALRVFEDRSMTYKAGAVAITDTPEDAAVLAVMEAAGFHTDSTGPNTPRDILQRTQP